MSKTNRDAKLIIILGFNGTGKTTLIKQFVKNHLSRDSGRSKALIVTPDDREFREYKYNECDQPKNLFFTGANTHIFDEDISLDMIRRYYKHGLLIFDDCRGYFRSNIDRDLHSLLIRRRQNEIDIIASGHGFTEIPPKFFTFASEIILFHTKDNIYKRRDCLRNFDDMQKAQERVNHHSETNAHYFEVIKQ